MPAVIPLIAAGVSAYATYKASSKQSDANKSAAELQAGGNQEALDFEKQREAWLENYLQDQETEARRKQAAYENALQPYQAAGRGGLNMASSLLGLPPASSWMGTGGVAGSSNRAIATGGASAPPTTNQGSAMVTLEAPDGSRKDVPSALVTFYTARGAKPVSQSGGPLGSLLS